MDKTDKDILLTLQEQARLSMTELGKTVAMSQPAVTERVKRLEESEVIDHYRAIVNPHKVNRHTTAFLLFHTKDCEKFIQFCEASDDVIELHRISGQYNYLLKVVAESMETLESFINASGKHGDSTTLIVLSSPIKFKNIMPIIKE
ncbi:Lrp/AsnC family transcriptional regulator [Pseudalkalibacillus salsuginis]|uniref:Lrp/AsnC family transcriptional regulator n=1 Tax=Pseudalkalibacillus salsuginis TaxID=2910972 RepID=UPI001F3C0B3D|nr:Lrp/AsnC family transcriptional regulator [Pseudalkalibacillus salsuginis]MCF6409599.1 Lrp/AsnC family transcriptional regulator [Pseudalkalibacillus salsuginis]